MEVHTEVIARLDAATQNDAAKGTRFYDPDKDDGQYHPEYCFIRKDFDPAIFDEPDRQDLTDHLDNQ
jgi:hypothetical protein